MKKKVKILATMVMLLVCIACGKKEGEGSVTSTPPSSEGNTYATEESTTEQEATQPTTTKNPGIMPNTLGIVIREPVKEEESTAPESAEKLGLKLGIEGAYSSYIADEDAKKLGVSKILGIAGEFMPGNLDPDVVSKFNELLVKKYGCDFVVSFYGIDGNVVGSRYNFYYEILEYSKNMKEPVDIIFAMSPAYYSRLIRDDFLMDITDYLMTTEDGQKFYNAYAEELWKRVTINDKIYGYIPTQSASIPFRFFCNKEKADKFGLDIKEGFSFYDIGPILEKANLSKEELGDTVPFYLGYTFFQEYFGCDVLGDGIAARKNSDGSWTAINMTENKDFIRMCKTIREYREKGWLRTDYSVMSLVEHGDFIFAGTLLGADCTNNNQIQLRYTDIQQKRDIDVIYDVIGGEEHYGYNGYVESGIYGVTSWSEYKEETLKLLTLISTEEELINLLNYGIEGEHYSYSDGKVTKLPSSDGWGVGELFSPANPSFSLRKSLEPDNKAEYYKEMSSKCEDGAVIDSFSSGEEFVLFYDNFEQVGILSQIYEQGITKLLKGEYEDVDAAIAEINRMQKEAGIDEVIDAINERFKKAKE